MFFALFATAALASVAPTSVHASAIETHPHAHHHLLVRAHSHARPHTTPRLHSANPAPLAATPDPAPPPPAKPRHAPLPARYVRHHTGASKFSPRHVWAGNATHAMAPQHSAEPANQPRGFTSVITARLLTSRGPPRAGPTDDPDPLAFGVEAHLVAPPRPAAPLPARLRSLETARDLVAVARPAHSRSSASVPPFVAPTSRAPYAAALSSSLRRHSPLRAASPRAPASAGARLHPGRSGVLAVCAYEGAPRCMGSLVEEIVP